MRIVFCGNGWLPIVDEIGRRLPAETSIRVWDRAARPLVDELRDAQVILPSNGRIDAAAVAAPRDLRLIQQPAAGYEAIDLDAARARGVPVCNAPGVNAAAVAELTLLLLLGLARLGQAYEHDLAADRDVAGPLERSVVRQRRNATGRPVEIQEAAARAGVYVDQHIERCGGIGCVAASSELALNRSAQSAVVLERATTRRDRDLELTLFTHGGERSRPT
jgi:lactate dehydrogenase-like 2-hydroxyacid dehydrogenase